MGEPIEKRFTVRTVTLNLRPKAYGPDDLKVLRKRLNASQTVLARFLGVSVKTLRSWEQGTRKIPPIACRFLDEIVSNPDLWNQRLREALSAARSAAIES
ncbi:MAG TPA: helix-turn-helix domain-containing protein [Isosphaeraceae bacterium]|nr:helix-turn-helix domain-containing protein [Isosphaeraceae bacterium]